MVEIDELVITACRKQLPKVSGNLSDPRVSFIFTDGIEFVKNTEQEYDVIIVDSSDPKGPAEQLFEVEFYQHLKNALKDDGILVCQSQSPLFQPNITRRIFNSFQNLLLMLMFIIHLFLPIQADSGVLPLAQNLLLQLAMSPFLT